VSADDGHVIGVDQGTGSTKAIAVDRSGRIVARACVPVGLRHPRPGWVEQDAQEIVMSVETALTAIAAELDAPVTAVGLSSQRESAVLWETATARPAGPILGWQDRRTADAARSLAATGVGPLVREITGLPIDPMFSALKIGWLLDSVDPDRRRGATGELTAGTVDAWLVAALTGDRHIEVGNASRTQLMSLADGHWHPQLLAQFRVPGAVLPRIVPSDRRTSVIQTIPRLRGVPITAVLGDSHAALFAHGVRAPGTVKVTYGTGSSLLGIGTTHGATGLVDTIAWGLPEPTRAFEGNILSTGATLVWLAGLLGCSPERVADLAASAHPDHGVDLVPAFGGLGAPWWDGAARPVLTGFSFGTTASEIARAALESIVLQVEDVVAAAEAAGGRIDTILVDGGPSSNDLLAQLQADLSRRRVERSEIADLSALGAAHLAGLACGVWTGAELEVLPRPRTVFEPSLDPHIVERRRASWSAALAKARSRPDPDLKEHQ
jgi:glycerol kinase